MRCTEEPVALTVTVMATLPVRVAPLAGVVKHTVTLYEPEAGELVAQPVVESVSGSLTGIKSRRMVSRPLAKSTVSTTRTME